MADVSNISMLNGVVSDYINQIAGSGSTSLLSSTESANGSFDAVYNAALGLLESTNTYIEDAQQAEIDFALGNLTNSHELGVAQQKANLALQYTVAIRDKVLEAYKEIMNMQI